MKKLQKVSAIGYAESDWKSDWKIFKWTGDVPYDKDNAWQVLQTPYVTNILVDALTQQNKIKVKFTMEEVE